MTEKMIYAWEQERMVTKNSLREALQLSGDFPALAAFTGGGGKTTTMYALAKEMGEFGKRVFVTTSTHIRRPKETQSALLLWPFSPEQAAQWQPLPGSPPFLTLGEELLGGKLKGLPGAELERMQKEADLVLVEADGARGMPVKIPRSHEPVIPQSADLVIVCAGLDCLGKTVRETCFGWQEAWEYGVAREFGLTPDTVLDPAHLAVMLTHEKGGHKGVGERKFAVVLNKADNEMLVRAGNQVREAFCQSFGRGLSEPDCWVMSSHQARV